ncbi:MAG: hypothetical protein D8M59_10295 [Planctomycetes bacterium]|nr:hypothetical protein [Planctomycetota bacterium]NOG55233.1 hypothetical protein [Planctomycetota bacterium]
MEQYLYRVQPTRTEMLSEGPTEDEAAIVQAHFEYLQRLTRDGIVLMAARTLTTDSDSFGIVIFEADSVDAARSLMNGDPAVHEGVMSAELFPCRVALWSDSGPGGIA